MYFYPLHLVRQLPVSNECRLLLYEVFHDAVLRAHEGQSLDVSLRVSELPQTDVDKLSAAVMELKTGSLTALGLALGGIVGGLRGDQLACLVEFGRSFGVALQMFDDVGNLTSHKDPEKQMEDLKNRRISYVWGYAARCMNQENYHEFLSKVKRLPDREPLMDFFAKSEFIGRAKSEASTYLEKAFDSLMLGCPQLRGNCQSLKQLQDLGEVFKHAF